MMDAIAGTLAFAAIFVYLWALARLIILQEDHTDSFACGQLAVAGFLMISGVIFWLVGHIRII